MHSKSTPLCNVRVLDLTLCLAGRWAAMLLAEQGAEVIRITDNALPTTSFDAYSDRGKRIWRSDKQTLDVIAALAESADVVLIDGLWEQHHGKAPAWIEACPINIRFTGESIDDAPVEDDLLHAWLGVFTDVSVVAPVLGLPPIYTALPMASAYGAVLGANAAVAALIRLCDSGHGDRISIPLAAAVMAAMGSVMFKVEGQPWRYDIPPLSPFMRQLMPVVKAIGMRGGAAIQHKLRGLGRKLLPPLMRFYACADGQMLFIFAFDHQRLPIRLLEALELWDALKADGLQALDPYRAGTRRDNICDAALLSPKWKRKLGEGLARKFRTDNAEHWEALLVQAGVPCAVVRTTAEWKKQDWVRASELVTDVTDPEFGMQQQFGLSVSIDGNAATAPPLPRLIERDVPKWRATGVRATSPTQTDAMDCLPLRGIKVLDLASMVAGPLCARTLAELGAEVIKLDPVKPLHGPRMTAWYGIEVSHGKRSALLDMNGREGQALFQRLAQKSDIVVHNLTGDAWHRIGEQLQGTNAIECGISAFGGPALGAWSSRKGYDPVLQAAAGVTTRFGTPDEPELHAIASCVDCLTGYLAAFGALCALFSASPGTHPPRVRASLAQAVQFMQGGLQSDADQLPPTAKGPTAIGQHALRRLYKARDGWLFVCGLPTQGHVVARHMVDVPLVDVELAGGKTAEALARFIAKGYVNDLVEAFGATGLKAVRVHSLQDWHRISRLTPQDAGPVVTTHIAHHPCGYPVTRMRPNWLHSAYWSLREGMPFPKPGADTRSILRDADIETRLLDASFCDGHAADSLSREYLPK